MKRRAFLKTLLWTAPIGFVAGKLVPEKITAAKMNRDYYLLESDMLRPAGYESVGNREDLSDVIYDISPTDTPYLNSFTDKS